MKFTFKIPPKEIFGKNCELNEGKRIVLRTFIVRRFNRPYEVYKLRRSKTPSWNYVPMRIAYKVILFRMKGLSYDEIGRRIGRNKEAAHRICRQTYDTMRLGTNYGDTI